MTLPQLITRLKASQASKETICNVIHVWQNDAPSMTLNDLLDYCCKACFVTRDEFMDRRRFAQRVICRSLFHYYARTTLNIGPSVLGEFANRDHTTSIHSYQALVDLLDAKDDRSLHYLKNLQLVIDNLEPVPYANEHKPVIRARYDANVIRFYYDRKTNVYYRTLKDFAVALGYNACPSVSKLNRRYGERVVRVVERVEK